MITVQIRTSVAVDEIVVSAPSHRTTRANVFSMRNGTFRVEYKPTEVGMYKFILRVHVYHTLSMPSFLVRHDLRLVDWVTSRL